VRVSLAMVCMMFIAHTISGCQQAFNVCSPDAYPCLKYLQSGVGVSECIDRLGVWPMAFM
jgi:hypothetical protein